VISQFFKNKMLGGCKREQDLIYFPGTFKSSSLLGAILWINQSSKDNNKNGSYKVDKNKPSNKLTLIILSYCFPHSTYWQSAKEGELVVAFPLAENSEYPALPKQPTTIYLLLSSFSLLS